MSGNCTETLSNGLEHLILQKHQNKCKNIDKKLNNWKRKTHGWTLRLKGSKNRQTNC